MTTATHQPTPVVSVLSPVEVARLFAARQSLRETTAQLAEEKGNWTDLKKLRGERQDALLEALDAAEKAHGKDGDLPGEEARVIYGLQVDFASTAQKFELSDRAKNKLEKLEKKLAARLMELIDSFLNVDGDTLYSDAEAAAAAPAHAADAFLSVQLADLVETGYATPFTGIKIQTVADFLEALRAGTLEAQVQQGTMHRDMLNFMLAKVESFLTARGRSEILPENARGFGPSLKLVGSLEEPKPSAFAPAAAEPAASDPGALPPDVLRDGEGNPASGHILDGHELPFDAYGTWWALAEHGVREAVDSAEEPRKYLGESAESSPYRAAFIALDSIGAKTPAKLLGFLEARWSEMKRGELEGKPESVLPFSVECGAWEHILHVYELLGTAPGEKGEAMRRRFVALAAVNVDAFINVFGDVDGPINKLRLLEEDKPQEAKPAKKAKKRREGVA